MALRDAVPGVDSLQIRLSGVAGPQSPLDNLAAILGRGNRTSGKHIIMSSGDMIQSPSGLPVVVEPGTAGQALSVRATGSTTERLDLYSDGAGAIYVQYFRAAGNPELRLQSGTATTNIRFSNSGDTGPTMTSTDFSPTAANNTTLGAIVPWESLSVEDYVKIRNDGDPGATADYAGLYAFDVSAGNTSIGITTEGTGAVTASVATPSTHKLQIAYNGTTYYILMTT